MSSKINVDFFPITGGSNPYIDILKQGVEDTEEISILEFKFSFLKYIFNKKNIKIVYLNWYDNVQNKNLLRTIYSILKRLSLLKVIKIKKIKVFIVIHNRLPHNAKNINLLKWYIKKLFIMADKLVILSTGTKNVVKDLFGEQFYLLVEDKFVHIPCTHYIGIYEKNNKQFRKIWGASKENFIYLFWGSIKPYKNIELLINIAHEITSKYSDTMFVIAGECSNAYAMELKRIVQDNTRIKLYLQKIEDDELADVIDASDIVVIPLDLKSSINSGTCFVTFSLHKNIICPRIEGLKDFSDEVFFDYEYDTYEQHHEALLKSAESAYIEWKRTPEKFYNRENILYAELEKKYSGKTIGGKLRKEFEKLLKDDA